MTKEKREKPGAEVKIYSIASSPNESIIFLDETEGTRILPIWIGPSEAQAIAIRLSGYPSPRPMTHDLIFSIIKQLGLTVREIAINKVQENTYFAELHLSGPKGGRPVNVDCRPSDAIAVAVRFGCPVYVSEEVFSATQTLIKPISDDEVMKFRHDLKNLTPSDLINKLLRKPAEKKEESGEEKDNKEKEGGKDE